MVEENKAAAEATPEATTTQAHGAGPLQDLTGKIELIDDNIILNEEFKKNVAIPYFKDIYKDLAAQSDAKSKGINKVSILNVSHFIKFILRSAAMPNVLGGFRYAFHVSAGFQPITEALISLFAKDMMQKQCGGNSVHTDFKHSSMIIETRLMPVCMCALYVLVQLAPRYHWRAILLRARPKFERIRRLEGVRPRLVQDLLLGYGDKVEIYIRYVSLALL